MTTISIAMATYNGARHIAEQLESLAAQTRAPHELVVCDDGSSDETVAIVEGFAAEVGFPVRVVRNEANLGYADNFLKAASLCEGEWVAFCDQDDVWAPEKLERVAGVIGKNPDVLLVAHPAYLTDADGRPTGEVAWPSPERRYRRLEHNPWRSGMGCGQVFRAMLVKEIPYDRRFRLAPDRPEAVSPHDDWVLKLSQCLGDAHYMAQPLVYRRRHAASVTADKGPPTEAPRATLRRGDIVAELERTRALAADRAQVLRRCAEGAAPAHRRGLLDGAAYYERAAEVLRRRAAWRGKRGLARLRGAGATVASPAYWRTGPGIAGWRGLIRELTDLARPAEEGR